MTITRYKISDITNFEDFLNKLFNGLKHYEKKHLDFKFKIKYSKDYIELNVIRLNEQAN
jgi:hypothetical protein